MKILSSVSWGKPALELLSYANNMKIEFPTIICIRHSARDEPKDYNAIEHAQLTQQGIDAALEFGSKLPVSCNYRVYYSPSPRCGDTAKYIQKSIQNNNGNIRLKGAMYNLAKMKYKKKKFQQYLKRDYGHFMDHWISGHYSPSEIEPAFNVAQRTALEITKNSQTAELNTIDIYVSHDIQIVLYLFYWAGILATKQWIQYLDGFVLQFKADKLKFYHSGKEMEIFYPYWWNKFAN